MWYRPARTAGEGAASAPGCKCINETAFSELSFDLDQQDRKELLKQLLREHPRHAVVLDAYLNHNGEQPNNRAILKAMQDKWAGRKVDNKTLFDLFPGNPSKQAGKVAGLPESMRKGGY
jgi:TusE/DsrC/DsvC family sulfur relay protein